MVALFRKLWQSILGALLRLSAFLRRHWRAVLGFGVGLVVLTLVGWAAYLRAQGWVWADWTGFGEYTKKVPEDNRGKTLWDWLELLIIPVVLALGAFWLQQSERNRDRKFAKERFEHEQNLADQRRKYDEEIAKDQQQEAALQGYTDKMTALLLDEEHPLRQSTSKDEVRVVARTLTLSTLRGLDPVRKGVLLRFLFEAGLIQKRNSKDRNRHHPHYPIVSLHGANLGLSKLRNASLQDTDLSGVTFSSADLFMANLHEANLDRSDLSGAYLFGANLVYANLCNAYLSGADFTNAKLEHANLQQACLVLCNLQNADLNNTDLRNANLLGANLAGANFSKSNMEGTKIDEEQLAKVGWVFLKDAVMPDGKTYNPLVHSFVNSEESNANKQNGEGQ